MRNLSIIFAMLFFGITLFAQEETVSYIMNDGSVKTYKLNDIEDVSTKKGQATYEMKIYLKNSAPVSYFSNQFDGVKYRRDSYNNYVYIVYSKVDQFRFLLANIDSVSYNNNIVLENTVKIGNQIWMTKNLDVATYRNGKPIRHCQTNEEWIDAASKREGAWCYYNNDPANGEIYGKLYNWFAVNDPRGLAPAGWHVPTDEEWKELEMCLGMTQQDADKCFGDRGTDQGAQLASRADLWYNGELEFNANFGISGFSALPGGRRLYDGTFSYIGSSGYWWSSENISWFVYGRTLHYNSPDVRRADLNVDRGFSVRCVRD